jgi:hypothetical protein
MRNRTDMHHVIWTETTWASAALRAPRGPWISICNSTPELRTEGGVVATAHQRVAELDVHSIWEPEVKLEGQGNCAVLSAWVLDYPVGGHSGLHTDRPDSDLTGLIALDDVREPLVVCPQLSRLPDGDLLALAFETPHPAGVTVYLRQDRVLLLRGASTPHHRPPVASRCRVLSISLKQLN